MERLSRFKSQCACTSQLSFVLFLPWVHCYCGKEATGIFFFCSRAAFESKIRRRSHRIRGKGRGVVLGGTHLSNRPFLQGNLWYGIIENNQPFYLCKTVIMFSFSPCFFILLIFLNQVILYFHFKDRSADHTNTFRHEKASESTEILSKYLQELKNSGIEPEHKWRK